MNKMFQNSFTGGSIDYDVSLVTGFTLILYQWWAMLKKRSIYTIRNWMMIVMQNLIPISFVVIAMVVVQSLRGHSTLPPLEISLDAYERSVTIIEKTENVTASSLESR